MYKKTPAAATTINRNKSYKGETIEQKIHRIINNKEPIKDGAPRIYTERKDGVKPELDIRTDRWEKAVEATDYITKSELAKREHRLGEAAKKGMEAESKTDTTKTDGGAESTQATDKK